MIFSSKTLTLVSKQVTHNSFRLFEIVVLHFFYPFPWNYLMYVCNICLDAFVLKALVL